MSFAGKAAAPLALAAVGYGAFKGLSSSREEDSQYAQDLGKEGLLKRAFKTAINPVRQGRIIASTVRNMFGLTKDLSNAGVSKLKVKSATAALDKKRISKLKELGASEEDLKRFEALSGDDSNEALKEKNAIYVKYSSKKPSDATKAVEGIPEKTKEGVDHSEKDSGKLSIPQNVAQALMDTSDTMAEFKSELRDYVDEHYPDASASSRRALIEATVTTMWGNKGGVSEKTTESSEESKTEESSKDKITGTKLDGVRAVLKGVPKQKKSGWGSKLLKATAFASPVGLLAMGAKKFNLTGKAAKGLKWVRGKTAGLVGKAADYLEGVAANARGEGFLTDLKDIAATGSRALADKLKGGQAERAAYVEKIMSMPAEEAVKMVGPEEYDKLRREYQHTRMKHHLGLWDRMTGKQIDTSGMLLGAKDTLTTDDNGTVSTSDISQSLNASIVNRRKKTTGTVEGLHGALERRASTKEVVGPDGKVTLTEDFVDNDKENVVEAMSDLHNIGRNLKGPGEYTELGQSKRSAKDVYDALDRFAPKKQTFWDKITATKPKSPVNTASSISDKQMAKHDGVNAYLESKQPSKAGDAASQQAAGTEALVQATTSGNSSIVDKLAEMVNLMKEQIVVTSDSKVAQEKATSEGAQKALTAAMAYAKETAQNAVAASRPKPRREPAINVAKPVPA